MDLSVSKHPMPNHSVWQAYIFVVAVMLLMAGFGKTIGLQQEVGFLSKMNPLFSFITNRQLFSGVAFVEVALAVILLSKDFSRETKIKMIFWLSLQFAIYRGALFLAKEPAPCKCFGDIFGWLGMSGAFLFLLIPSTVWMFKNKFKGL
jgi:hypothetical protein